MKVTWLNAELTTQKIVTIEKVVREIKEKPASKRIETFREDLSWCAPAYAPPGAEKIPAIIFSSGYKDNSWSHYNGLVLLEFNKLPSYRVARTLQQQIIAYKQPYLTFLGISNLSVKVVIRYTLPGGSLPVTEEEAARFHEQAYRHAALHYKEQFPYPVTLKEPVLRRFCRISSDSQCFYNPDTQPIRMELSHGTSLSIPLPENKDKDTVSVPNPLQNMLPGYELYKKMELLFETCLDQTMAEVGKTWEKDDTKSFIVALANKCLRSGIPEEEATRWIFTRKFLETDLLTIRLTVRNVYRQEKMFGSKPCLPRCTDIVLRIEEFLKRRYRFRKNQLNDRIEYKEEVSVSFRFRPLQPEVINDMVREARKEGIDAWNEDIEREIHSSRTQLFHPVKEFLGNLPPWDGTDRIRPLAARVPTTHTLWKPLFYKWFVAMVAQWIKPNRMYGNSLVPVLTGGQGIRKSTFYRMLIPRELEEYYIENMTLDNRRDAELKMAQHVLVVLDEFDRLNRRHQAELKHLIQLPVIKVKKPYRKNDDLFPRLASFAANANPVELLTDPTGSRRYLCVEVTGTIDTSGTIHYEQLYAQALHAINQGETYWLTEEEEKQMQEINTNFQQLPLEMQYVFTYFRLPKIDEEAKGYYAVEIWEIIKARSKQKFSTSSGKAFSHMLAGAGIPSERIRGKNKYFLIEK
ncbi:MAG: DUF3874 domain-containing protein [Tannerellaceae bacterium]|nr:DUF3874 domain-containing protein [Tannerellaceae bacterium]